MMRFVVENINGWNKLVLEGEYPSFDEFQYEKKSVGDGTTLYWAKSASGIVSFYCHMADNESGFGGHVYHLQLVDGTVDEVRGPWSSNGPAMNAFFEPVMDITLIDSRGYRLVAHITVEAARVVLGSGFDIRARDFFGDTMYEPVPVVAK